MAPPSEVVPGPKAARRLALAALLLLVVPASAAAQNAAVCQQIRRELASADSAPAGNASAQEIRRLQADLSRARLAIQRNDCNREGFLIFGPSLPPICAPLKAQAAGIEARLRQLSGGGSNPRRAQLLAAYRNYGCDTPQVPPRGGVIYATPGGPSLFDQLFGGRGGIDPDGPREAPIDPRLAEELEQKARLGGRMAICVRTCDGAFFPVNFEGMGARDEYQAVCEALCPSAETRIYFMPAGADLDRAATRGGEPYSAMPNAFAYREKFDPSCRCKPPGTTWAQATKGAEDIVEARKGDVTVTPEQAIALSRPKALATDKKTPRGKKKAEAEEPPAEIPESAIPTAGTASSGLGRSTGNPAVAGAAPKESVEEVISPDGKRRQVRVVAPNPIGPRGAPALRGEARP